MNTYTVSGDGTMFCYYNNGWLIKSSLSTQIMDSVYVNAPTTVHLNVLLNDNGFSVIYFDKKIQYDTTCKKEVILKNYDTNMKLLDSTIILSPKFSYLLVEDFVFSSIFVDKLSDKIYLNDDFSRLTTLENKNWSSEWQDHTVIDISNGTIYKIEGNGNKVKKGFSLNSSQGSISLNNTLLCPSQFSVLNNKIIYYQNRILYWKQINSVSNWDSVAHNWFNPCKRFIGGLYHFEKATLALLYLN